MQVNYYYYYYYYNNTNLYAGELYPVWGSGFGAICLVLHALQRRGKIIFKTSRNPECGDNSRVTVAALTIITKIMMMMLMIRLRTTCHFMSLSPPPSSTLSSPSPSSSSCTSGHHDDDGNADIDGDLFIYEDHVFIKTTITFLYL